MFAPRYRKYSNPPGMISWVSACSKTCFQASSYAARQVLRQGTCRCRRDTRQGTKSVPFVARQRGLAEPRSEAFSLLYAQLPCSFNLDDEARPIAQYTPEEAGYLSGCSLEALALAWLSARFSGKQECSRPKPGFSCVRLETRRCFAWRVLVSPTRRPRDALAHCADLSVQQHESPLAGRDARR